MTNFLALIGIVTLWGVGVLATMWATGDFKVRRVSDEEWEKR